MHANNPELLQLHGIALEDLAQEGVSLAEFHYIHMHMEAGSVYHHVGGERRVKLTEVRKDFLRNAKVRAIWKKCLRARFFNLSHPYAAAVDAFVAEIEARGPDQSALV